MHQAGGAGCPRRWLRWVMLWLCSVRSPGITVGTGQTTASPRGSGQHTHAADLLTCLPLISSAGMCTSAEAPASCPTAGADLSGRKAQNVDAGMAWPILTGRFAALAPARRVCVL